VRAELRAVSEAREAAVTELRERAALLEVELTERARDTAETEELHSHTAARLAAAEAEAERLRERAAVLEIELAERAADLEAADLDRQAAQARAGELHERMTELDRRRAAAERHAEDVVAALADTRDGVRRRLGQLDSVDARLAALAQTLDADQLLAEARTVRTQWSEIDRSLEALDRLADTQLPAQAERDGAEPIRLVATELFNAGHSRADVENYLREELGIKPDPELLDGVFASASGD
jgi:chromosome segregation ATPase